MAKKKPTPKAPKKPKGKAAAAGIKKRLTEKDSGLTYKPNDVHRKVRVYVKRRMQEMMDYRTSLKVEDAWREADAEYVPHELEYGSVKKRFETDQDTGIRSRLVPVGDADQQWRENSSAPTLLAKIQTALSIIVDQMPEAELVALLKKYHDTTDLAYALWKRNWQITDAKEKLKLVLFDLLKYGWKPQRTYPRIVKYPKRVLETADTENRENDTYSEKEVVWFNDVDRQPLDVYRTWIDELSKPYDPYSTNEAYFELDFSYDAATVEFGEYPNWEYVKRDSQMIRGDDKGKNSGAGTDQKIRKDVVTIGFFESRHKDLSVIYVPKGDIVLYVSPMPNDDGYLSITHTLWILRNSGSPYGVSLWQIIKQNKGLYDKMKNMTMDQLVLSIMKFGFFTGTNTAIGDGKVSIVPGQARQLTSSTGKPEINWMEIPGPGDDSWKGLQAVQGMMDDDSGISPTLEGQVTGKTLGEILHAKEASLKRLKTPVENVAWLIEQDAYVTLSWMSQLYAKPTVMEFADGQELSDFEKENQINRASLFGQLQDDGTVTGPYEAHYYPQLALHLEDRDGKLSTSKKSKFYTVGKDIMPNQLKWKGIFKVIPRSIIDSSQELVKATKMEMFNLLVPLFVQPAQLVAKAAKQVVLVNEEDPKDWLPDEWLTFLDGGQAPPTPGMPGAPGADQGGIFTQGGSTMQGAAGATPQQASTVVPRGQTSAPGAAQLSAGQTKGLFARRL